MVIPSTIVEQAETLPDQKPLPRVDSIYDKDAVSIGEPGGSNVISMRDETEDQKQRMRTFAQKLIARKILTGARHSALKDVPEERSSSQGTMQNPMSSVSSLQGGSVGVAIDSFVRTAPTVHDEAMYRSANNIKSSFRMSRVKPETLRIMNYY